MANRPVASFELPVLRCGFKLPLLLPLLLLLYL